VGLSATATDRSSPMRLWVTTPVDYPLPLAVGDASGLLYLAQVPGRAWPIPFAGTAGDRVGTHLESAGANLTSDDLRLLAPDGTVLSSPVDGEAEDIAAANALVSAAARRRSGRPPTSSRRCASTT
jgi:hypothetical protein